MHKDILVRFENLIDDYLKSDLTQTLGLPTVTYWLHFSANYFGDLIKKKQDKQRSIIYR